MISSFKINNTKLIIHLFDNYVMNTSLALGLTFMNLNERLFAYYLEPFFRY
jgi:hypothetical protein